MIRRAAVAVAALLALAAAPAASAFGPNDPLVPRQWYLRADRAFEFWATPPILPPVKVAIVDSGIDGGHPELAAKIVAAKSFVGGSPLVDTDGHGTFVAGELAAALNNGQGIAGIAFPARLLVAKAVKNGVASIPAETAAIRWAVDHGARVINLSIAGLRDPVNPGRDTYSPREQRAIDYAVRHGALVVAAAGNGDAAPSQPWAFASYPAALQHVLGVAAYGPNGSVPAFSDRDAVFDDLAAPGQGILSTFPRALTVRNPGCFEQGYSSCGPDGYPGGNGTSFSAPQVAAAAALLFATRPALTSDQVSALLEHSALDASRANGCSACRAGRDSLTGWGKLDVAAALRALARPLPPADRLEPNDDAGARARVLRAPSLTATLDFWDDRRDVYALRLRVGRKLVVRARASALRPRLILWKPTTRAIASRNARHLIAARGSSLLTYRARAGGTYFLEVRSPRAGSGKYTLRLG